MRIIPEAALPIAALVCGYPGEHRRLRHLMMLKAYVDDSMTDGAVLVLAGLVATVERWEAFSVAWQQRLDAAPWNAFKAADVMRYAGDRNLEHVKWHYFTIREYVQGGICVAVPLAPLKAAAQKYGLVGTSAANPYHFAFKGILNNTARHQRKWGADEPIDFIFDERTEEDDVRGVWDWYLSTLTDDARAMSGRKPQFEDDEKVLPLQAADMWAWWCRKGYLDHGGKFPDDFYPVPWGTVGEIPQMIFNFSAEEVEREMARISSQVAALQKQPSGERA